MVFSLIGARERKNVLLKARHPRIFWKKISGMIMQFKDYVRKGKIRKIAFVGLFGAWH
jgi:hypothetical protein